MLVSADFQSEKPAGTSMLVRISEHRLHDAEMGKRREGAGKGKARRRASRRQHSRWAHTLTAPPARAGSENNQKLTGTSPRP